MSLTIVRSIMRCTTVLGRVYEVIQFDDQGWGIARDGNAMPELYWPASQMDQCVKAHGRLCMIDSPDVHHEKTT